jgi:hypothetical protein
VVVGAPVSWKPRLLWRTLDRLYPATFVALLRREYVVDTIVRGSTVLRLAGAGR